jgi:hypothetical protein
MRVLASRKRSERRARATSNRSPASASERAAQQQHAHSSSHDDYVRAASALSALAGFYILFSAWIRDLDVGNQLNGIVAGAAALIFAVARYTGAGGRWASWGIAAVGAWLVLTPSIYRYSSWAWSLSALVVGFALVVLGASSAREPITGEKRGR